MLEKSEGFIIRRRHYRDTSLLITVYTKDFGKVNGIVKGVRKIEDFGRYDGLINLFSNYEVVFYRRRSELALFVQFYLIRSYWKLLENHRNYLQACLGFELLDFIMPPYDVNKEVYELLRNFLEELCKGRGDKTSLFAFILKLLRYSGFNPKISECLKCGGKISKGAYFSMEGGGLICPRCKGYYRDIVPVKNGTIKSMRFLELQPYEYIRRMRLSKQIEEELEDLLFKFISYHISYSPKEELVEEIRG
jgi:DNA repair protein RecO (recombination protein O)